MVPFKPSNRRSLNAAGSYRAVLVQDEGPGQGADLEQAVPVGVVAGEAGHLQAEDDPRPAHPHLGHQALEPLPVGGGGPGVALVGVDHHHLLLGPSQSDGPLAEGVLALGGFGVLHHLA